MTVPERPAFSEEKSAILTDPAYSFLSFRRAPKSGSTGDESSLGATQPRSKLRNVYQLKFFDQFPFFDRLGFQKKEATAGKETS